MRRSVALFSSKSTTEEKNILQPKKKIKSKSEKFSFANISWGTTTTTTTTTTTGSGSGSGTGRAGAGAVGNSELSPLVTSLLQSGLKLLVRENKNDNVGFRNCIMWLKEANLEIWTPTTGDYKILELATISTVKIDAYEENILLLKCLDNTEYQLKVQDGSQLEQLRLILKTSTAKSSVPLENSLEGRVSNIESKPTLTSQDEKERLSSSLSSLSSTTSSLDVDENMESQSVSNSKFVELNSKLSRRTPVLNSPSCSEDRISARARLRSRTSSSALQTPKKLESKELPPPTPPPPPPPTTTTTTTTTTEEITPKRSPKRPRDDEENNSAINNDYNNNSAEDQNHSIIRTPKKGKVKPSDKDIIVRNDTISL